MPMKIRIATLAAGVAVASQAMAAETPEKPGTRQYLAPMASYMVPDKDRSLSRNGLGASLIYGRELSKHWWWETEAAGYWLDSNIDATRDFFQYAFTTGVSYAFFDRDGFTPFVMANIGGIYNDVVPDDDDALDLHANMGLGVVTGSLFDNGMKLRAEARYLYDDFDGVTGRPSEDEGGFSDWRFSLGVEFPLGGAKVVEKTVYETREVERVVEVPATDAVDQSAPEKRDECPDALPDAKVDGDGCMLKNQIVVLSNIGFELGSADIAAPSAPMLDRLVTSLETNTGFNVEIAGHADSSGPASYNQDLSARRAAAVREYLIDQGIDAQRLSARGYGEEEPIASNDSLSGRAMNRRVEFRISE